MDMFNFLKNSEPELTDEQKKWNKMWYMWSEGQAESPYAELMNYQSEVNNGGHEQYFFNMGDPPIGDTSYLLNEMNVLKAVLPAKLKRNLQNAYNAYLKLADDENDEHAEEILDKCDSIFVDEEEKIDKILLKYASQMEL